jgi:hypothetical protein
MWSMLRCYKHDKSRVSLVGRRLLASKGVNMEAEEVMAMEAFTRRQLVKLQWNKKTQCML